VHVVHCGSVCGVHIVDLFAELQCPGSVSWRWALNLKSNAGGYRCCNQKARLDWYYRQLVWLERCDSLVDTGSSLPRWSLWTPCDPLNRRPHLGGEDTVSTRESVTLFQAHIPSNVSIADSTAPAFWSACRWVRLQGTRSEGSSVSHTACMPAWQQTHDCCAPW
jgi:hypothetical protein